MKTRIIHLPSTLLAAAVAATLSLAAAPHAAADRDDHRDSREPATGAVHLKTGVTSIVLADTFKSALTTLGVDVRKIIPGQIVKGRQTLRFPIRAGVFDLDTLQAEVAHAGGITLKTATTTVSLSDFVVTLPSTDPATDPNSSTSTDTAEPLPVATGPQAELSALVVLNGDLIGRVPLLALDLTGTGLTAPLALGKNRKLSLPNVGLNLTAEGADALNAAFGVTTFVAGDTVGTASILASTRRCDD